MSKRVRGSRRPPAGRGAAGRPGVRPPVRTTPVGAPGPIGPTSSLPQPAPAAAESIASAEPLVPEPRSGPVADVRNAPIRRNTLATLTAAESVYVRQDLRHIAVMAVAIVAILAVLFVVIDVAQLVQL